MPKVKRKWDSFEEVERITLNTEQGSTLLIVLKKNQVNTYKLEHYLNGDLLKPENLSGKSVAYKRWAELVMKIAENRPDFKPLTPEIIEEIKPDGKTPPNDKRRAKQL